MNAKQMIAKLDGYGGIIPFNSEELEVTLRALRLLAAADGGEGTPETDTAVYDLGYRDESGALIKQDAIPIDFAQGMERQRNALAARVAELEDRAASLQVVGWLRGYQFISLPEDARPEDVPVYTAARSK